MPSPFGGFHETVFFFEVTRHNIAHNLIRVHAFLCGSLLNQCEVRARLFIFNAHPVTVPPSIHPPGILSDTSPSQEPGPEESVFSVARWRQPR